MQEFVSQLLRIEIAAAQVNLGLYKEADIKVQSVLESSKKLLLFPIISLKVFMILSESYRNQGHLEEALGILTTIYDTWSQLIGKKSLDAATILNNRAIILQNLGRHSQALSDAEQALSIFESHYGENHPAIEPTLYSMSVALFEMGETKAAEKVGLKACEMAEEARGQDHPYFVYNLCNLAEIYRVQGRVDKATEIMDKVEKIENTLYATSNYICQWQISGNKALLHHEKYEFIEAERLFIASLKIIDEVGTANSIYKSRVLRSYAVLCMDLDRFDEAEKLVNQAIEICDRQKNTSSYNFDKANSYHILAQLFLSQGKCESGMDACNHALTLADKDHPYLACYYTKTRGELHFSLGNFEAAESDFKTAAEMHETKAGRTDHWAASISGVARTLYQKKNYSEANDLFQSSLNVLKDDTHTCVGVYVPTLISAGYNLIELRKFDQADLYFEEAFHLNDKIYDHNHSETLQAIAGSACSLVLQERLPEAKEKFDAFFKSQPSRETETISNIDFMGLSRIKWVVKYQPKLILFL